ncbi:probable feruloyl esterase A at C-terminar half [Coccomyxa sp. Obi]|nr:probable feruloyl esterase A at C-terminar half [Coccomyxa sp. Obi]
MSRQQEALPEIILRPWQEGIESAGQPLAQTAARWQARIAAYARTSFLSAYAAFVDNTLVALLQALRLDDLFRRATPWLEDRLAALTGTWHKLADGRKLSYSLVNNTSPDFSIPRQYSAPIVLDEGASELSNAEGAAAGYRPALAHFLSLCMKLVYEKEEVMQDTVETRWDLRFHNYFHTGTETFIAPVPEGGGTAPFVPRTRAALLGSPHALVLVFRGSEPTNLINLRSSGRISMTERKGLGRVHDGFYGALFHDDEESGILFDEIVKAIEAADPEGTKALYVTGHSLGAALSLLFAQVVACRKPAIADRIAAIYGFAPPRVGDAEFADHVSATFCATSSPGPNRAFRVCHGADIICRLPPRMLQYADAGQEVFVTSTGRVLFDPKEVKRWHNIEGWGFIPLYLYKLVAGMFDRREKLLRSLYRVFLLVTFPGLTDHWPADYEGKLRKALIREVEGKSGHTAVL